MSVLDRLDSGEDIADLVLHISTDMLQTRPDVHAVLVAYNFYGTNASLTDRKLRNQLTTAMLRQIDAMGGVHLEIEQVGPAAISIEVSKDQRCFLH